MKVNKLIKIDNTKEKEITVFGTPVVPATLGVEP